MGSPSRHGGLRSEIRDEEIEEDGQPPGLQRVDIKSFVETVRGSGGGGVPVPESVLDDDFVRSRMRLEFPDGVDGEPVITIEKEVLDAMNGLYKQCMLVKILGRHTTIEVLSRKLRDLWRPTGGMSVLDLPRQFFMVRFEVEEDYMMALTGGPWRVLGSILMVQAWSPEFNPLRDVIETTPVWVRVANLPVTFYHNEILLGIAAGLGKPIKVDLTTLRKERGRFARVCVEVNLKNPLKGTLVVNGERYFVSYEGLQTICSLCGIYGHTVNNCPMGRTTQGSQRSEQGMEIVSSASTQNQDGFTEVRRARNRTQGPKLVFSAGGSLDKPNVERLQNEGSTPLAVANSFGGLAELTDRVEVDRQVGVGEVHKENVRPQNGGNQNRSGEQSLVIQKNRKGAPATGGVRTVELDNRVGGSELGKHYVARGRISKSLAPGRGLVYGPTRGDLGGVSPGKRLRVEHVSVGRDGGVFTNGSEPSVGASLLQVNDPPSSLGDGVSAEGTTLMEVALPELTGTPIDGDGAK